MITHHNYILNSSFEPIREDNLLKWAEWYEKADRHVAKTDIGDIAISTVFLGIDHQFDEGVPILWETMIFGFPEDHELHEYQERYATFDEAKAGHQRAVEKVKEKVGGEIK